MMAAMADRITFSNERLESPALTMQSIRDVQYPLNPNITKATRFTNRLGLEPGTGWILIRRAGLTAINTENTDHVLSIKTDRSPSPLEFKNLCITSAKRVTPGKANDPEAVYLCQIADRRHLLSMMAGFSSGPDPCYNLPSPMYTSAAITCYEDSENPGTTSPWTWQEMLDDIWPSVLGTAPTLPYTPHDKPYGFDFRGVSIKEALEIFCHRLCIAIRYIPSTGDFDLVELGKVDTDLSSKLTANEKYLAEDDAPLAGVKPLLPSAVRVRFHRWCTQPGSENTYALDSGQWQTQMVYTESINAPSGIQAKAESSLRLDLWDDLPALTDFGGSLTNASALTARAEERRDKVFQWLDDPANLMQRVYAGVVDFQPGSRLSMVSVRQQRVDQVDGWMTEISYMPGRIPSPKGRSNTLLRPPINGPQLPNYPQETAFLRIEDEPDEDGVYEATEVRQDGDDLSEVDGIAVLTVNANPP